MIVVNIKGGLGNQMFQYAFALARKDDFKLDLTGLELALHHNDENRAFALDAFKIAYQRATVYEIQTAKYPHGSLSRLRDRIEWFFRKIGLLTERIMSHDPYRKYFDGYWQSPEYFESIRETILSDFTLRDPLGNAASGIAEKIRDAHVSISLHVRRGDYVTDKRVHHEFGTCAPSYYQKAIANINDRHPDAIYFVFSDDIPWVTENLKFQNHLIFVSGHGMTDVEELMLMKMCDHNIIANSSFSWWGAWLNQNPHKLVIAPAPWFDTVPYDHSLIPKTWTTLPKN